MRAGRLTESVTLQRQAETVLPSGHVSRAWLDLATIRAELKQATADEYLTGHGEADATAAVFLIRWHPGVDVTPADRLVHRGRVFNLKSVVEIGRQRGLELRTIRVLDNAQ